MNLRWSSVAASVLRTDRRNGTSRAIRWAAVALLLPALGAAAVMPAAVPNVGSTPTGIGPTGKISRHSAIDIVWDPIERVYVMAWCQNPGFNPITGTLTQGQVALRVIRVDTTEPDPDAQIQVLGAASTLLPAAGPGIAFAPSVAFNPYASPAEGRYMILWSEGDTRVFANSDDNDNDITETPFLNDPMPIFSTLFARRFNVDAATGAVTFVGNPINVSGRDDDNDGTPDDGGTDDYDLNPDVYGDVVCDGSGYLIVWQELTNPLKGTLEAYDNDNKERNHFWWTRHVVRGRRVNSNGTFPAGDIIGGADIAGSQLRVFVSSGNTFGALDPAETFASSNPSDYADRLVSEYVPLDMAPRVATLTWPGPDGLLYTADDGTGGGANRSLITWALSSYIFNVPKTRIRARVVPQGQQPTGAGQNVWDVFNSTGTFALRPAVTACLSRQDDDPATPENERFTTSFFAIAWQDVEEVAFEATTAAELFGSIRLRLAGEDGLPSGAEVEVAPLTGAAKNQWPSIAYSFESEQLLIGFTKADGALFNPVHLERIYHPNSAQFTGGNSQVADLSSLYPGVVATIDNVDVNAPTAPDAMNHHFLMWGGESDYSQTYVRRFKNPGTPAGAGPRIQAIADGVADDDPALPNVTIEFRSPDVGTAQPPRALTLRNIGGGQLGWTVESAMPWLTVNGAASVSGPSLAAGQSASVSVGVDVALLTPGTHTAELNVISPMAVNSPMKVAITVMIDPAFRPVPAPAPVASTPARKSNTRGGGGASGFLPCSTGGLAATGGPGLLPLAVALALGLALCRRP